MSIMLDRELTMTIDGPSILSENKTHTIKVLKHVLNITAERRKNKPSNVKPICKTKKTCNTGLLV